MFQYYLTQTGKDKKMQQTGPRMFVPSSTGQPSIQVSSTYLLLLSTPILVIASGGTLCQLHQPKRQGPHLQERPHLHSLWLAVKFSSVLINF